MHSEKREAFNVNAFSVLHYHIPRHSLVSFLEWCNRALIPTAFVISSHALLFGPIQCNLMECGIPFQQ